MSACSRTYTTLCIYTDTEKIHDGISDTLALTPTRTSSHKGLLGWFISTENVISTTIAADHIKYLVDLLSLKHAEIEQLHNLGCKIKFSCFWESASGNGGPCLPANIMLAIGKLNIDLEFDIWLDISIGIDQ